MDIQDLLTGLDIIGLIVAVATLLDGLHSVLRWVFDRTSLLPETTESQILNGLRATGEFLRLTVGRFSALRAKK